MDDKDLHASCAGLSSFWPLPGAAESILSNSRILTPRGSVGFRV